MVAFGGDEVSALVFDFGSRSSKIGFAGQDSPLYVFPSYIGSMPTDASSMEVDQKKNYIGDVNLYQPIAGLEIASPFENGNISDWNLFEQLWEYSYQSALKVVSSEHPVVFADPSWDSKQNREKLCELAFEKYNVPGFYLGRSAVLSAFAAGRSTALVIESGASNTSIVPVFDGYVVKKAIQKAPIGGDFVSSQVLKFLHDTGVDTTPQNMIASKTAVTSSHPPQFTLKNLNGVTNSFKNYHVHRMIDDFKETICHVAESGFNERDLKRRPVKNYEFPTGFNTIYGIERFQLVESLFQPGFVLNPPVNSLPSTIPQLMTASVQACDLELQPVLHNNAVLTGANTMLPGFADRVYNELHRTSNGGKIKVQAAGGSNERKFGPWIGGSILASLASFHQLWISKAQYEEMGVSVEKKIY